MSNVGKFFRIVQTKTKLFHIIRKEPAPIAPRHGKKNGDANPHLHCQTIVYSLSCFLISHRHIRVF